MGFLSKAIKLVENAVPARGCSTCPPELQGREGCQCDFLDETASSTADRQAERTPW